MQPYKTMISDSVKKGEFRSKLDIRKAVDDEIERCDLKGVLKVKYPLAAQGHVMDVRLERFTWHLDLDFKQIFNETGEALTAYVQIDSQSNPTPINMQAQDLPSLLAAHDLGTMSELNDYTVEIKWKKKVNFNVPENKPPIKRWIKAIGLDPTKTYKITNTNPTGDEELVNPTKINFQELLINPSNLYNVVMQRNDVELPIYGDRGNQAIFGQFIAHYPIQDIVIYNADNDSSYTKVILLGTDFKFQIIHQLLEIPLNKLTLNNSFIFLELKGHLV